MGYLITFYFIAMDFFTGLLKAFATDSFSSKIMRRGLFHKLSLLCVLALGWLMEYAQRFVDLGLSFAVPVGTAACVYIILMEAGSIMENLCRINPELSSTKLWKLLGMGNRMENTEQEEAAKQLPMEEETAQAEEESPNENQ
jgi:phage-related holin